MTILKRLYQIFRTTRNEKKLRTSYDPEDLQKLEREIRANGFCYKPVDINCRRPLNLIDHLVAKPLYFGD